MTYSRGKVKEESRRKRNHAIGLSLVGLGILGPTLGCCALMVLSSPHFAETDEFSHWCEAFFAMGLVPLIAGLIVVYFFREKWNIRELPADAPAIPRNASAASPANTSDSPANGAAIPYLTAPRLPLRPNRPSWRTLIPVPVTILITTAFKMLFSGLIVLCVYAMVLAFIMVRQRRWLKNAVSVDATVLRVLTKGRRRDTSAAFRVTHPWWQRDSNAFLDVAYRLDRLECHARVKMPTGQAVHTVPGELVTVIVNPAFPNKAKYLPNVLGIQRIESAYKPVVRETNRPAVLSPRLPGSKIKR